MGKYNKNNLRVNVKDFQHPADVKSISVITGIPAFEKILEFISKNSIERTQKLLNTSCNLKVTRNMAPKIFDMLDEAAEMFGCTNIPEVYYERKYEFQITLDGMDNPYIT